MCAVFYTAHSQLLRGGGKGKPVPQSAPLRSVTPALLSVKSSPRCASFSEDCQRYPGVNDFLRYESYKGLESPDTTWAATEAWRLGTDAWQLCDFCGTLSDDDMACSRLKFEAMYSELDSDYLYVDSQEQKKMIVKTCKTFGHIFLDLKIQMHRFEGPKNQEQSGSRINYVGVGVCLFSLCEALHSNLRLLETKSILFRHLT